MAAIKKARVSMAVASDVHGIELADGQRVLPGLSNSFDLVQRQKWWQKNSISILYVSIFAAQIGIAFGPQISPLNGSSNDSMYDAIPIAVFMGDLKPMVKKKAGTIFIDVDDVFGNQYVKKKEEVYDVTGENDPRIGAAEDVSRMVGMGTATAPVDLTPQLRPLYTAEARAAGVTGITMLEIVVSNEGQVLRVRTVGKKLGYGLDEAAAATFRQKKFQPSMDLSGKALTVKFYQPVRFVLN
jgi:protein TonB